MNKLIIFLTLAVAPSSLIANVISYDPETQVYVVDQWGSRTHFNSDKEKSKFSTFDKENERKNQKSKSKERQLKKKYLGTY